MQEAVAAPADGVVEALMIGGGHQLEAKTGQASVGRVIVWWATVATVRVGS